MATLLEPENSEVEKNDVSFNFCFYAIVSTI